MQRFVLVVMGLALSLPASCLQELMGHLKRPGSSSTLVSSSTNNSDDQHDALAAARPLRRSQRLWASVTPEAVSSMQGITTAQLAGQFFGTCHKIICVHVCHKDNVQVALALAVSCSVGCHRVACRQAIAVCVQDRPPSCFQACCASRH